MVTQENFWLDSEGIGLASAFFVPEEGGPHPGLVICHGMPAGPRPDPTQPTPSNGGLDYPSLAEMCAYEGFATLIFNFRGAGESGGNFHPLGWAHDLEAALTWIQANPQVDENRTMLLGSSMGAAVAIHVAAHRKEVAGLVSFASPAMMSRRDDPAQAVERLRELGVIRDEDFPSSLDAWNEEYETLNPVQWIAEISPRPLLILQGDADDVVPHRNASLLFEKAGEPKRLQLLPGVGHRFRQEEAAISASLEWLKQTFLT